MRVVYHIATSTDWNAALRMGVYTPRKRTANDPLVCVSAQNYLALADTLFAGSTDLRLLFIDTQHLQHPLRESEVQGISVLHIAAPLPLKAVFEVADLIVETNGQLVAHHEIPALTLRANDTFNDVRTRALHTMTGYDRPWWVAGGWAVDLFLGTPTRPHADLEFSVLASDLPALAAHLHAWDVRVAAPGAAFVAWNGQPLPQPYHQLWARCGKQPAHTPEEFSVDPTMVDFLIEAHEGTIWQYRRDSRITRSIHEFGYIRDDLPYVRPEIALLFKAKNPRYKDQRDFEQVVPFLDPHSRLWLRTCLQVSSASHPWATALS